MKRTTMPSTNPSFWQTDFPASLVTFLVALPLSLGIAMASGAPLMSGIIAGVCGGAVAGLLGGAPLQVSGPAAGLTVLAFGLIRQFGFGTACAITACAGLVQCAMGAARVARLALAIPPAVTHGMLAGIGALIVLGQTHVILGATPSSTALENMAALPERVANARGSSVAIGALVLGLLTIWPRIRASFLRKVPGPIAAIGVATLLANFLGLDAATVNLEGGLLDSLALPEWNSGGSPGGFALGVFTLALVASAESLLCAVATDKLHDGPRADLDRELLAQGAANLASGCLGGLPVTGVVVRSSANIAAGARSRLSAILHAVWLALFVGLLASWIERVPLAALAGLLVHAGIGLLRPRHLAELSRFQEVPLYLITFVGILAFGLLAGIGIGLGCAALRFCFHAARLEWKVRRDEDHPQIEIQGHLSFMAVPQLEAGLKPLVREPSITLRVKARAMDHAAYEILESWKAGRDRLGLETRLKIESPSETERPPPPSPHADQP